MLYSPATIGIRPAIDEVVTTWPPSPCAWICGTKERMPLPTPRMLTSISQSQSRAVAPMIGPVRPMPALFTSTSTRPYRRTVSAAAASTASASVTSSRIASTVEPGGGELGQCLVDELLPAAADDHLHACPGEREGDAPADAAGAAGDECDLALDVLHQCPAPSPALSGLSPSSRAALSFMILRPDLVGLMRQLAKSSSSARA